MTKTKLEDLVVMSFQSNDCYPQVVSAKDALDSKNLPYEKRKWKFEYEPEGLTIDLDKGTYTYGDRTQQIGHGFELGERNVIGVYNLKKVNQVNSMVFDAVQHKSKRN